MIYALEGPDGCGKTTLFKRLKHMMEHTEFKFVNWGTISQDLWEHIEQVEQRNVDLFSSLYEKQQTYFCDRFFTVTGPIYAQVYNRPIPRYRGPWESGGLVVCYVRVPQSVAFLRMGDRGDMGVIAERHAQIHRMYEEWVAGISTHEYQTHIIDGTRPIDALVVDVQRIMRHHGTRITLT